MYYYLIYIIFFYMSPFYNIKSFTYKFINNFRICNSIYFYNILVIFWNIINLYFLIFLNNFPFF